MLSRRVTRVLPVGTLVAALVVGGLGLAVHGQRALRLDRWADHRLIHTGSKVHHLAVLLRDTGNPFQFACLLGVALVIWVLCAGWGPALAVGCGVGLDLVLIEYVLKPLVGRNPPFGHGNTFPSGHTGAAFGLATVEVVLLAQPVVARRIAGWIRIVLGLGLLTFATGVGLAMVVSRAHYFTDVVAGVPIGIMVPLLTVYVFDRFAQRRKLAADRAAQAALAARPTDPPLREPVRS